MFRVVNRGDAASTIVLELHVDDLPLYRESVKVAAAASWVQQLQLKQAPLKSIQLRAGSGASRSLQLETSQLLPVAVQLTPSCGADLRRTLQTHPGLRIAADSDNNAAVMAIACAGEAASASLPSLLLPDKTALQPVAAIPWWTYQAQTPIYLDSTWLQRAKNAAINSADEPLLVAGANTLLARRGRHLVSALDLQASALVAQPVYPLLITQLLDQLTTIDLHHGSVTARATPLPEHSDEAPEQPLAPYLILLCLLLLGGEMLLYRKP